MGILLLQTFIASLRDPTVHELRLDALSGKKIAVDISIYLYRFLERGSLIESIYMMCAIFREYGIVPVFVFDGEHPGEKSHTLQERKEAKIAAKEELESLKSKLNVVDDNRRTRILQKMDVLHKQAVTVKYRHICLVKSLLDSMGLKHVTAPQEADELCACLAMKGIVYACLSEDTDIIAYGCRRVLRYFSLVKHTVVLYDMNFILRNLKMSKDEFKDLCLVAGNDYIRTRRNIFYYYKLFQQYSKSSCGRFLDWLLNKRYLSLQEYHALLQVEDLYTFKRGDPSEKVPPLRTLDNGTVDDAKLHYILKKHANFVFP